VLGQYDPVLMLAPVQGGDPEPAALFLVEPNIRGFEERHEVPPANLRRWLVLHELTHAWQFEAHPWLRDHIGELMGRMLMSELGGDAAAPKLPSAPAMLRTLPSLVRRQLDAVGTIQAVMSVCEGYSNFVMHQVGSRHLADFDRLEQAFHERAQQRNLLERLVLAVTGMNMKLRQYEVGERFAEAVTAAGGLALLNRVWEGPEQMPTMAELREPQRWVDRIRGKAGG
jgi:coenzyme F420 biosynthesis associated uncharacterized protein